MIKGIIFDMDGTLIDSNPMHYKAWSEIGNRYGFNMNEELFKELNGMVTQQFCQTIIDKFNLDADCEQLSREKRNLVVQEMANGVKLFDGAIAVLLTLKRLGYRIAVGSSSPHELVVAALGPNLPDIELDAIVAGDEVMNGKPAPDIFLKCSEIMYIKPEECMVVEDSLNGIEAAKSAGMYAVAVTSTTSKEHFTKADKIISSISEINSEFISACQ